jgi:hypothetical protein
VKFGTTYIVVDACARPPLRFAFFFLSLSDRRSSSAWCLSIKFAMSVCCWSGYGIVRVVVVSVFLWRCSCVCVYVCAPTAPSEPGAAYAPVVAPGRVSSPVLLCCSPETAVLAACACACCCVCCVCASLCMSVPSSLRASVLSAVLLRPSRSLFKKEEN